RAGSFGSLEFRLKLWLPFGLVECAGSSPGILVDSPRSMIRLVGLIAVRTEAKPVVVDLDHWNAMDARAPRSVHQDSKSVVEVVLRSLCLASATNPIAHRSRR